MGSEYVTYGSLIYLDDEGGSCVCTGSTGASADSVALHASADLHLHQDFAARAVFVVEAPGTWTALNAFKELAEQQGLSLLEAQTAETETRAAFRKSEQERERNANEAAGANSKVLRFGMAVQLLHHSSGKYLASCQKMAAEGGRGHRVSLDAHAGDAAQFRVMARLRVHNEGERCVVFDPVKLPMLLCTHAYAPRLPA